MQIRLSDHFTYTRLIRFTLPSIAMMIFTSIYSVVDGFFVSNFAGKTPFAAVNLIMPFIMIVATVGFMFGTGGTAIVAKSFGEGKPDYANRCFSLFVYTAFGIGVVVAVLGFIFIRPISTLLGASGELLENCVVYARILLPALPFFVMQLLFQSFFVTAEKPQMGLIVTVSSGVTNMVLDAVLVILLPREYKLIGAAIASAASQTMGGMIPLLYFFRPNSSLLRLGKTSWDGKAILRACVNGSSEFMSNIAMSLVGMLYNRQLLRYAGENGVAAYGVMMYVSMIFAAAFIGYSIGTSPVIGYHNGAANHAELRSILRKSLRMIGAFGVFLTVTALLCAEPLAKIFVGYDASLVALTVSGFRIFSLSFLLMGFTNFSSGFFTALGDGLTSALISFLRTLVFETSAILLLPLLWDITGVWVAGIVAESLALLLSIAFLIGKRKRFHY